MTTRAGFNQFANWIESAQSASTGVAITPGNNTYGSYATLASALSDTGYGMWLCVNSLSSSGQVRDALCRLAVDPAGGASFAGNEIGSDLICSCAGPMGGTGGGGLWWWLPILFPANASIGIAISVNNATVGSGSAFCRLPTAPSHPELLRLGSAFRTYGSTPASSSGTAVTPNSAGSKSSYVQLGTIAAGDSPWFWLGGVGCSNGIMNNNTASWDFAIGSSTTVNTAVIRNMPVQPSASETLQHKCEGAFWQGNPGDLVFARAGGQAASVSGMSAAAYGVI